MDNKEIKVTIIGIIVVAVLMFFAGRLYENTHSLEGKVCTKYTLCNNAKNAFKEMDKAIDLLRDYQLDLHNDTVRMYDGDRLVGSYISNWKNQMDTIILNDNQ